MVGTELKCSSFEDAEVGVVEVRTGLKKAEVVTASTDDMAMESKV